MQFNWLNRIISRINASGRRYKSEKTEFISSNAMFYKVLGRDKKAKRKMSLKNQKSDIDY